MPAQPDHGAGRAERGLGADVDPAHLAARLHDPVLVLEGPGRGHRRLHRGPHPWPGRRRGRRPRCASSVPANSSGSTPWMRCSSSLHCTAPLPTSHSHRPTCAWASPPLRRASTSASGRLREPLLGDVLRDRDRRRSRCRRRRRPGRTDSDTGTGIPSGARQLGLDVVDPVAGQDRLVDDRRPRPRRCSGNRPVTGWPTRSCPQVAGDPLGAPVPHGDAPVGVVAEEGIGRRVGEGLEHREALVPGASQTAWCWTCSCPLQGAQRAAR